MSARFHVERVSAIRDKVLAFGHFLGDFRGPFLSMYVIEDSDPPLSVSFKSWTWKGSIPMQSILVLAVPEFPMEILVDKILVGEIDKPSDEVPTEAPNG